MSLEELKTLLTSTGYPVSFSSVPLDNDTARPYITFFQDANRNFAADGIVYYSRKVIIVRLYTDTRDEAAEAAVESALSGLFWSKDIEFLEDQKIYEISYQFEE